MPQYHKDTTWADIEILPMRSIYHRECMICFFKKLVFFLGKNNLKDTHKSKKKNYFFYLKICFLANNFKQINPLSLFQVLGSIY